MTRLRSSLFNLYFLLLTLGMGLGGFAVRLFARRHALAYASVWCRLTIRGLCLICGIRIELSGAGHLPDGPVLIASQHQSAFDALVWLTLVRRPAYIMKRELTRLPLVGPMLLLAGMIPVDRKAGAAALRGLLRDADAAVADGRQLVIFPEGTRVGDGEIVALQPGIVALALHTGLPVLPVATDSGQCWRRHGLLKHPGTIHIAIGPPITAEQLRGRPRSALAELIRAEWSRQQAQIGNLTGRDKAVDNSVGRLSAKM